ncbi:MAG: tryptophanase [candidate division Zixibacteria bacterium DG_27]|nr:MAG: tryptophanase [candidate division Zixibacteria bacterium DG_27]
MKTIPEPYRIKTIEPIKLLSRGQREKKIREAKFNLFRLRSEDVYIDLLTDSGTSALSDNQWAGLLQGDEAYAGSRNYYHFVDTIKEITGFKHVIPVHQGRAAENLLFTTLLKKGDIVPSNTHFDTTRANIERQGAIALDFITEAGKSFDSDYPFKGNMDLEELRRLVKKYGKKRIPAGTMTVTNNSGGGQPASMENIKSASRILHRHGIKLLFDACRYAENAYFIKKRESGYARRSVKSIAREMFSYADGCTVSAKKDGLSNIGGFIALNDDKLATEISDLLILLEGFPTYGGLAGRDLEAIARGLREGLEEDYLDFRVNQVAYLGRLLEKVGLAVMNPTGGHAAYVEAGSYLPHIPRKQFPAQALTVALYREGGIRSCEFGGAVYTHVDRRSGKVKSAPMDLVRLAIPRRVYTRSHLDYVAEVFRKVEKKRNEVRGLRTIYEPPKLRIFTVEFEEI